MARSYMADVLETFGRAGVGPADRGEGWPGLGEGRTGGVGPWAVPEGRAEGMVFDFCI